MPALERRFRCGSTAFLVGAQQNAQQRGFGAANLDSAKSATYQEETERPSKMPTCELAARTGFQIMFEGEGASLVGEHDGGRNCPGSEPGGVGKFTAVVFLQPLREILGETRVVMSDFEPGLKGVDVVEFHFDFSWAGRAQP